VNQNKEPSSYIQQYAVYEHLGSGAFGSVYKVKCFFVVFFVCLLLYNPKKKMPLKDFTGKFMMGGVYFS